MIKKGNLGLIVTLFGSLLAGSFLSWTSFGLASADTNLQFAVSECPVVGNGIDEESGECPDLKSIEKQGDRIVEEQSSTSAPSDPVVEEQSSTRTTITQGFGNPFGP
jgi:hypothetical protein